MLFEKCTAQSLHIPLYGFTKPNFCIADLRPSLTLIKVMFARPLKANMEEIPFGHRFFSDQPTCPAIPEAPWQIENNMWTKTHTWQVEI